MDTTSKKEHVVATLTQLLSDLFYFGDYSDVTIVCDGNQQIKSHKFLLSQHSKMFKAILSGDSDETELYLPGVTYQQVFSLLELLYLGKVSSKRIDFRELRKVAESLQFTSLLKDNSLHREEPRPIAIALSLSEKIRKKRGIYKVGKKGEKQILKKNSNGKILCLEPSCDRLFNQPGNMKQHFMTIHKGAKYPCTMCEDKFSHPRGLRRHIQSVHLKMRFPCESCSYQAACTGSLRKHTLAMHLNKTYTCQYCQKVMRQSSNLTFHLKTYHLCDLCTYIAKDRIDMDVHKQENHGAPIKKRTKRIFVKGQKTALKCDLCDKKEPTTKQMKRHLIRNHICDMCDLKSKDFKELREHKRIFHGHGKGTPTKQIKIKRGRGRPPGSKNKMKIGQPHQSINNESKYYY